MNKAEIQVLYKLLFTDYPDIVTVRQLTNHGWASAATPPTTWLGEEASGLKLGNAYKIPKINVIRYVVENGIQPGAGAAEISPV